MKKFGKGLLAMLLLTGLAVMFGCALVQDAVIPCHINQEAIDYAGIKPTSYVPWTTLHDAQRIRDYVNYNHIQYQNAMERLKKDDRLSHAFVLDGLNYNIDDSLVLKKKVFSPTGAIGLAFPALAAGTFGAMYINTGKKKKA